MIEDKIKFKGYRCFKNEFAGFDRILPVNVIIGRNNSGKSCLLDLIRIVSEDNLKGLEKKTTFAFSGILNEEELISGGFAKGTRGGRLKGQYWGDHGKLFVDTRAEWEYTNEIINPTFNYESPYGADSTNQRKLIFQKILKRKKHSISGLLFNHLLADRDIVPEKPISELRLYPNGNGATNIIRKFLTSANNAHFPRNLIRYELLEALNTIFAKDAFFTEIQVQMHDEAEGVWEVYLGEKNKGLISLGQSGSGLKTIILVLLNLLVIPKINNQNIENHIFAFEELENNLHPALLRRLLTFIETFAIAKKCYIFLTTHSNIALDIFYSSNNAQIIHVEHNRKEARTKTLETHLNHIELLNDLGAKPSDLLQANGVIWLEGPSDRIYVNKFIEIYSNGDLIEGKDYQCAYTGGSLLAKDSFATDEESDKQRANLLKINSNAILIADGDRTAAHGAGSRVKKRVSAIKKEIEQLPNGYVWITDAKEIENYVPEVVLENIWNKSKLPPIGQYEYFYHEPTKSSKLKGYFQKHCRMKTFDKVKFANQVAPNMTLDNIKAKFDLDKEMQKIIAQIKKWNE